jgi:hypothetical protein
MKQRRRYQTPVGLIVAPALSLLLLCGTFAVLGVPQAAAAGSVAGTVFRDYNSSGLDNTTATPADPAVDVGVGGVTVAAFDSNNTQVGTATSAADGTFAWSSLLPRVTSPDRSALPLQGIPLPREGLSSS